MQADHSHIFWLCPRIQTFWEDAGGLRVRTLGVNMDMSFSTLYLGVRPEGLCKRDAYVLKVILAACKKSITKCWLQKDPLTVDLLISAVSHICSMEKMTFTLRLQKDEGKRYWNKWDRYLQKMDTE